MFLLFCLLLSCSTIYPPEEETPLYRGSGLERFFLPTRPHWSHFSELGKCWQSPVSFLDFKKLYEHYQLSYSQAQMLQRAFHQKGDRALSQRERNSLFYEAYQKTLSLSEKQGERKKGVIHFVLVDDYLSKKQRARLKKNIEKRYLLRGEVFLLSRCLDSKSLEAWKKEQNLYEGIGVIGLEAWSVFDRNFQRKPYFRLELEELFPHRKRYLVGEGVHKDISIYGAIIKEK